jgi:hypothetical protein
LLAFCWGFLYLYSSLILVSSFFFSCIVACIWCYFNIYLPEWGEISPFSFISFGIIYGELVMLL